MWFPRQEYWNGLPFLSPGSLPPPSYQSHVSCIDRQIRYHWKPLNTLDWSQQIPRLAQIQGERDFTFWWEELQNCIAKGSCYREVKCCGHFLSSITTTWQACLLGQITSLLYVMVFLYLKHKIHIHTYTPAPQRSELQASHVNQTSYVKILWNLQSFFEGLWLCANFAQIPL